MSRKPDKPTREEKIAELFHRHHSKLKRIVQARFRRREGEDLVQEMYARLCRSRNISEIEDLINYGITIALNEAEATHSDYLPLELPYDPDHGVIRDADRRDMEIDFMRALAGLKPRHKEVLALRLAGYRTEEIARVVGMHIDKVRRLLGECYDHLMRKLWPYRKAKP